ncbi:hypothetical protein LSAT2_012742 [Lamellibrachia satsuma]|nr:hypothetical protein LSAT2_012742 [Lamellibrachia satsuma]
MIFVHFRNPTYGRPDEATRDRMKGAHSMLAWLLCVLMAVLTAGGDNKGKLYSACHMQCVQQFDKCLQLDNCGRPFKIEQDLPKHCWNKGDHRCTIIDGTAYVTVTYGHFHGYVANIACCHLLTLRKNHYDVNGSDGDEARTDKAAIKLNTTDAAILCLPTQTLCGDGEVATAHVLAVFKKELLLVDLFSERHRGGRGGRAAPQRRRRPGGGGGRGRGRRAPPPGAAPGGGGGAPPPPPAGGERARRPHPGPPPPPPKPPGGREGQGPPPPQPPQKEQSRPPNPTPKKKRPGAGGCAAGEGGGPPPPPPFCFPLGESPTRKVSVSYGFEIFSVMPYA